MRQEVRGSAATLPEGILAGAREAMRQEVKESAATMRQEVMADLREALRQGAAVFTEQLREMKAGLMPVLLLPRLPLDSQPTQEQEQTQVQQKQEQEQTMRSSRGWTGREAR